MEQGTIEVNYGLRHHFFNSCEMEIVVLLRHSQIIRDFMYSKE